jgi:hypothetical protein
MTDTDTYTIVPLSEWDGGLQGFISLLRYPAGTGRRQRFEGDHQLLGILAERLPLRPQENTVADIREPVLRAAVEDVATLRWGSWELGGTDSQSVLARLDAHFAGLQKAYIAHRRQDEAVRATWLAA